MPNHVFVLVMNRNQLEKAVKGVYGAETDAAAYLGKFLHLSLTLPRNNSLRINEGQHPTKSFVQLVLQRYDAVQPQFADSLAICAVLIKLSLRDIQRAIALYFLGGAQWPGLTAYLIALKIRHPDTFRRMQDRGPLRLEEIRKCAERLHSARQRPEFRGEPDAWPGDYLEVLRRFLVSLLSQDDSRRQAVVVSASHLFGHPVSPADFDQALDVAMRSLDLDIS